MKMRAFHIILLSAVTVYFSSCDKVEEVEDLNRTVVVTTMHSPDAYHLDLGLNTAQSVANWDTSGEISTTIAAQVGDNILYSMQIVIPGASLTFWVNGTETLIVDFNGPQGDKTVAGSLRIE